MAARHFTGDVVFRGVTDILWQAKMTCSSPTEGQSPFEANAEAVLCGLRADVGGRCVQQSRCLVSSCGALRNQLLHLQKLCLEVSLDVTLKNVRNMVEFQIHLD